MKSRQFQTLNSASSTPLISSTPEPQQHPISPERPQARVERFLKATNSERYLPVSWRDTANKSRKENSSTSSSGSRDDTKAIIRKLAEKEQLKTYFAKPGRNFLESKNYRSEGKPTIKSGLMKVFPRMVPVSECVSGQPSARDVTLKRPKPVVICRTDSSYETIDNNNNGSVDTVERSSLYASLRGNGPRTGESLCQRLLQSGITRRVRCNYFQLKTGKFVSPKIVKASRRCCPKIADSLANQNPYQKSSLLLEKPTNKDQGQITNLTPRGKKTIQLMPIGTTDKAKVNREEIKRIFKLNQFKKRVASDLFLDNYRKRISLQVSEVLPSSPREGSNISLASLRSFSGKSFVAGKKEAEMGPLNLSGKYSGKKPIKATATSLLLQKVENAIKEGNLPVKSNIKVLEDYTISDSLGH